jgi:AcrR family transcriptional regulator
VTRGMPAEQPAPSIWLRPERAHVGRPAQHSRAEITAVALAIADREGLDAVSMRRVAAELGTGAASLYRYVQTREDLLDLMTDAAGAEYEFAEPTGDWLADLVALGEQSRAIHRRHPWLPGLAITRPVIGPNGLELIEHFLTILAGHPAGLDTKMEAFALLNGMTATSVLYEQAGGPDLQARNVGYLTHALASGDHPRLAALMTGTPAAVSSDPVDPADRVDPAGAIAPVDRYPDIFGRLLAGLLGSADPAATAGATPTET